MSQNFSQLKTEREIERHSNLQVYLHNYVSSVEPQQS